MKKLFLLVLVAVLLVAIFVGCGGTKFAGKWYDEAGQAGTLDFKGGGKVVVEAMGMTMDGTYEYDDKENEGVITIDFMGETQTQDFGLAGDKLQTDTATYTRKVVKQMTMEEMWEELGDAFEDLGDEMGDAFEDMGEEMSDALNDAAE